MKPVLCVGNAVVDVINVVEKFPVEDSDERGQEYYWQRGGNATNNCTVLSLLETPCEFMGILATVGEEARWLRQDFSQAGIPTDHCVATQGQCPLATSIISSATGSRTILAFRRGCPELTHVQFKEKLKQDFSHYSWVHFELRRSTHEIVAMMQDVNRFNLDQLKKNGKGSKAILSVEVEKPKCPNPELAMAEADFVFISKVFAESRGCADISQALETLYVHCRPGSVLVCPWGEEGAGARFDDHVIFTPARADVTVVDSLGAGDTFIAAFISSVLKESAGAMELEPTVAFKLQKALEYACDVAGYKCGIHGYQGLKDFRVAE